jgi:hypothetical protein
VLNPIYLYWMIPILNRNNTNALLRSRNNKRTPKPHPTGSQSQLQVRMLLVTMEQLGPTIQIKVHSDPTILSASPWTVTIMGVGPSRETGRLTIVRVREVREMWMEIHPTQTHPIIFDPPVMTFTMKWPDLEAVWALWIPKSTLTTSTMRRFAIT